MWRVCLHATRHTRILELAWREWRQTVSQRSIVLAIMSPMELAQYEQNVRRQMHAAREEERSELPMLRVLEEVATEWSFRAAERVVPDGR